MSATPRREEKHPLSDGRGFEERIRRMKLRAAAYRRHGREDDAQDIEDEIRALERLPKEGIAAEMVLAALELEEALNKAYPD
jgi:predicted GIY-YIG superfamily endonuclease